MYLEKEHLQTVRGIYVGVTFPLVRQPTNEDDVYVCNNLRGLAN